MKWVQGTLFVTNMGADHLGDFKPDDTMYIVERNKNYAWPYCFQYRNRIYADGWFSKSEKRVDCNNAPPAYVGFSAHSSPLGLEYFACRQLGEDLWSKKAAVPCLKSPLSAAGKV